MSSTSRNNYVVLYISFFLKEENGRRIKSKTTVCTQQRQSLRRPPSSLWASTREASSYFTSLGPPSRAVCVHGRSAAAGPWLEQVWYIQA